MKAIPEKLLVDLQKVEGFDKSSFLAAHQQKAVTSIRLHPQKGLNVFADKSVVPWCRQGRYLDERPVFTLDPLYHAGAYYVQEASSMFLDYMLRTLIPAPDNIRVLDLCAAPGGKSTLIASLLDSNSLLVSNEVIRTRASILEENVSRWGYRNTWVTSNDARDFGKLNGYFDVIVVDAPCSGSGLFRKDEHAIDEWSEANVQLCSERQQRILSDVWPALKEDGLLIYATCSYSPAEDENILDWLADNFQTETISVSVPPEWGIVKTSAERSGYSGYRFFPHRVAGEGFFLAAIRKKESTPIARTSKFKSVHEKKCFEQARFLMADDDWSCIKQASGDFIAINKEHENDLHLLSSAVYIRKAGINLGQPSLKEWLPGHDIALSVKKNLNLPLVNLALEQALRYLKKEDMDLQLSSKGWYIAAYQGLGLGWIKALGNRNNNYLPKSWRIRMDISDITQA